MEFTVRDLGAPHKKVVLLLHQVLKVIPDQPQSIIWELVRKADSQTPSQTH